MNKFKIYLAGKMGGLTLEEMNTWRLKAKLLLEASDRIVTQNPCDFYNFERDRSTYTELEVKRFDLWIVRNCNLVLVNLDHPDSIVTAIEIHMAHDVWNIPVIGFGTAVNHPWIETSVDKRLDTLEEAVDYINEFYLSNF